MRASTLRTQKSPGAAHPVPDLPAEQAGRPVPRPLAAGRVPAGDLHLPAVRGDVRVDAGAGTGAEGDGTAVAAAGERSHAGRG